MTQQELIDKLYTEMAEFSFLTKYIFGTGIEEININSWDDVEVQYSNGETVKLEEKFESPDHAINVVRRMLHVSGMVLDNTSPAILGHLSKNIRIAVLKTPLVDEDVGVAASIRIVNAQKLKKDDFLRSGTAADEMMELMSALVRYGVSTTVAGATSSGKTTLTGWLLTTIPHDKRIFTIENGSRELDLVERDENGKIINKVIHTITRESEDEKKSITQDNLLDMALRFHPDYIVVGEMRSSEADSAQEAARTGHTVITTIHSNSCESTWRRMVTLCKRKYPNVDDKVILHGIHLEFPKGGFISIVGESGCGKSTAAAILMGGNRGYSGSVKIGGTELSDIKESELMKNITYVSHQSYLFKGTVRENLLLGKPKASDGELWEVLERVNLADFLKAADGLDTLLKEKASNLSGGQRQRLALARALLHNSPVYIFDEATSNIDVESENDIMREIHLLAKEKTVILISHRLANVTASDNIYVMEKGRVAESGSHKKLLEKGTIYPKLWNTQQSLENYGKETVGL